MALPIVVAAVGGVILNIVGSVVGRVLIALGIGVATYTGVSTLLDQLKDRALSGFMALPPEAVQILGVLKVGEFVSIITSAVAARLLLSGMTSGTVKRWVNK